MSYIPLAAGDRLAADRVYDISGIWESYTPTWTGSVSNPNVGAGSLAGKFARNGQVVNVLIQVTLGTGFSVGSGIWRWTVPTAMTGTSVWGTLWLSRPSSSDLSGIAMNGGSSTLIQAIAPGGSGNWLHSTITTPVVGDSLTIGVTYHEA